VTVSGVNNVAPLKFPLIDLKPETATRGKRKQPERLSEETPNGDAIVRPYGNNKPYEVGRNDLSVRHAQ
jgi:hypothetical protein